MGDALITYPFSNSMARKTQRDTVFCIIIDKNPRLILCGALWYSAFSVLKNSLFYKRIGVKGGCWNQRWRFDIAGFIIRLFRQFVVLN